MKKNGAFVNLFLSEGLQKSPKYRGQPKKIGAELLCFSELEATAQKKPELRHANFKVIYIYGRQRRQNCLIG
jgi:hypothetical protein